MLLLGLAEIWFLILFGRYSARFYLWNFFLNLIKLKLQIKWVSSHTWNRCNLGSLLRLVRLCMLQITLLEHHFLRLWIYILQPIGQILLYILIWCLSCYLFNQSFNFFILILLNLTCYLILYFIISQGIYPFRIWTFLYKFHIHFVQRWTFFVLKKWILLLLFWIGTLAFAQDLELCALILLWWMTLIISFHKLVGWSDVVFANAGVVSWLSYYFLAERFLRLLLYQHSRKPLVIKPMMQPWDPTIAQDLFDVFLFNFEWVHRLLTLFFRFLHFTADRLGLLQ